MTVAVGKAPRFHALGRLDRLDRMFGVGQVHGPVFGPEKSTCRERLQLLLFSHSLEALSDINERRNNLVLRTEHLGHPGAQVRSRHGQGRDVSGMPMVLVAGMKDGTEVRLEGRADERSAVHHLSDVLQALGDLQPVHVGVDRGKGAQDLAHVQAHLEGMVALRIKRVGRGHSASQPDQDAGVGFRLRMLDRTVGPGFRSFGCQGGCGSHAQLLDEISADYGFGKIHCA